MSHMDSIYRKRPFITSANNAIVMNKLHTIPNSHIPLNFFDRNASVISYDKGSGGDTVLDKLGPVGFDSFPFFRTADAHIGCRRRAKMVFSNAGLHIGKLPARWQGNEQHS